MLDSSCSTGSLLAGAAISTTGVGGLVARTAALATGAEFGHGYTVSATGAGGLIIEAI